MCYISQGKDDVTGEALIQHEDDKPEALLSRLRYYKDVAKPVMDLYKSVYTKLFLAVKYLHAVRCCTWAIKAKQKQNMEVMKLIV